MDCSQGACSEAPSGGMPLQEQREFLPVQRHINEQAPLVEKTAPSRYQVFLHPQNVLAGARAPKLCTSSHCYTVVDEIWERIKASRCCLKTECSLPKLALPTGTDCSTVSGGVWAQISVYSRCQQAECLLPFLTLLTPTGCSINGDDTGGEVITSDCCQEK